MHNAGMIYGYARVSTDAQDLTSQLVQLKAAGCEKLFREKITGTTADRPPLKKLMRDLAPGDVVIPPAVDRLSRDVTGPAFDCRAGCRYHVRFCRACPCHAWRCREA